MHMWIWEHSSTWITQSKCELGYHGLGRYDIGQRLQWPSGSDGWVWSWRLVLVYETYRKDLWVCIYDGITQIPIFEFE